MGTTLVIIDPNNDFIDDTFDGFRPALPVAGSSDDMNNLIDVLDFHGDEFDKIVVMLDQHPPNHIAHAVMWLDRNGHHPDPFTTILDAEVKAGIWRASLPQNQAIQAAYVEAAEAKGVNLTIWEPHCIIGTIGAAVYEPLMETLRAWWHPGRELLLFPKSGYWASEQFSSLQAAVPVAGVPSTQFNEPMLHAMIDDRVVIAGEALGFCVAATVMDAIKATGQDFNLAKNMILLRDCTSNVVGFEDRGRAFIHEFEQAGGTVAFASEIFPEPRDTAG